MEPDFEDILSGMGAGHLGIEIQSILDLAFEGLPASRKTPARDRRTRMIEKWLQMRSRLDPVLAQTAKESGEKNPRELYQEKWLQAIPGLLLAILAAELETP